MMTTFFALCIATIFAGWVWSLKQELAQTQGHATPQGVEAPHEPIVISHPRSPAKSKLPASNGSDPRSRRADGVPCWTIDIGQA